MPKRLFEGKKPYLLVFLYFADAFLFFLSMLAAYILFHMGFSIDDFARLSIFSFMVLVVNYAAFGIYKDKRNLFDENEFMGITYSYIMTYVIIASMLLLFKMWDNTVFYLTATGFLASYMLSVMSKVMVSGILFRFRQHGYDQRRVLFFGGHSTDLVEKVRDNPSLGYRVVGTASGLAELRRKLAVSDIVFMTEDRITEDLMKVIIENSKVNWKIIPSAFNLMMDPVSFDEFKDYPIINVPATAAGREYQRTKRMIDVLLSGIAILLLSPVFLAIILVMKITMPGPVFYRQERMGKDQRPFYVFKFRTMVVGADRMKPNLQNEVKGLFKMKNDPRVTGFGNILRRTCIDELPQLFNIFLGDMSVVGPRPHLRSELCHFSGWRATRFQVKPGLTGMWQVNGRHELNFDKAVLYDIYYIKHMSLTLDISIILKTIPSIVFSRGRY